MHEEAGFTLVEMLVALALFGLIAAAGVGLLGFGVRAQAAAGERMDDDAALRRVDALLTADLVQAVPRITRGTDGRPLNAFVGDGGAGVALGLVRGGWSNPDGQPRASLQKVAWEVRDGSLTRTAWPMLDGAAPGAAVAVVRGVTGLSIRYRQADGAWRERWDALRPTDMPRLVELTLTIEARAPVTLSYLVGTGA
ncbi:type II secretion system minor pseudopilin GspJ [Sphingomonas jatrophae]|uniref:Type II secretion system protein J n=1 Tax=Sphingomonas jatrophae TaxID=1166337 RepID=A0A1I6JCZ9_9SPHN|nr:type II secretion system minor pseudopilin GspJ [Sphingomonas jatrophae]SFR76905.1 general secretion pathway protein J [Sphingomonas jatrophae]